MLTCDRCLRGDTHRCRRGDCANWTQNGRARSAPRSRSDLAYGGSRPGVYIPGKSGRPRATSSEEDHEIARFLVVGSEITAIARHLDYTPSIVRRVRDELCWLDECGVSAGPVDAERLATKRGYANRGRKGVSRFGVRLGAPSGMRASAESIHKAALLLCDGRSYRETAELSGLSANQCRTVKSNLRVLEAAAMGVTRGSRRW